MRTSLPARLASVTLTVAMVAGAAACGASGVSGDKSAAAGGKIVYAEQLGPRAAWALETDDAIVLSHAGCLEPLVRYSNDNALEPGLATSWVNTEPTVWDFTLRSGVTFQDGTKMDAEAVVGALQKVLAVTAPARAFNPKVVSGVKAIDASTVRITTPAPDVLMPLRMASPNTGILAPKAYAGAKIDILGTCTGPFQVTKEVPSQSIQLKRNDSYWGGKVVLAEAEVRFIPDGAARATQVQTGEVQIAAGIPAASRSTLSGDSKLKVLSRELPRTTAMILNNSRAPFNDPKVRKAMQYALDLSSIATGVYEGSAKPAVGPFAPEKPWTPSGARPVAADPAKATRLLQEAGVDPADLGFELIAYNDRPEFGDLPAVIQDQLAKIGVKVKIRGGDYASVEPDLLAGKFDAALLSRGYLVDIAEPAGYLASDFTCDGGYNLSHYCDKATDQLIKQAGRTADKAARHNLYGKVAQKLQDEAVATFLVHETSTVATAAGVQNFVMHPLAYYILTADLAISGS